MRKPVILTFTRYYLPGYKCGPITSISNLVHALGDAFDFRIVTSDRDVGDERAYPDIETDGTWRMVGKAQVLYLAPSQRRVRRIADIVRGTAHDALYLNSFFDPDFTVKPLLARRFGAARDRPCILAPRGEFPPGALKLKAWKKRPFIIAARVSGLYGGITWQATSAIEQQDIRTVLGVPLSQVVVAANLSTARQSGDAFRPRADGEPLRVCFLSRISPKKNLELALKALQQVQAPVQFDIYGPVEDEACWGRCRQLMSSLPRNVQATHRGSVKHEDVVEVLAAYDLFILPTLGENHGHVIHEALAAGTPVLISDTTPWRDLAKLGIGWDLPLDDPSAFGKKIDGMAQRSAPEQVNMRDRARAFAQARVKEDAAVEATRQMFARAAALQVSPR